MLYSWESQKVKLAKFVLCLPINNNYKKLKPVFGEQIGNLNHENHLLYTTVVLDCQKNLDISSVCKIINIRNTYTRLLYTLPCTATFNAVIASLGKNICHTWKLTGTYHFTNWKVESPWIKKRKKILNVPFMKVPFVGQKMLNKCLIDKIK